MNPLNRIIIIPSEAHQEFDDVPVLQPEGAAEEMLRDHFEDVRVVGADRHDDGAVHEADRREETLRAPERASARLESGDLNPRAVLEDLELREVRTRDLQIQRALVRLEPEFLPELVSVAFLSHVERALTEATRDRPRDRHRLFDLENPLVVGVLLADDIAPARRESDPLPAGREVSRDQALPDQFEDPLGGALLAHADQFAELARGQVHELLRPPEKVDRFQRLDVVRLQPRGRGATLAYSFSRLHAFGDEMIPGPEEHSRDFRGF